MDATELQIYTKMLEVYDKARSHFLFEIVELQVKRYLNAERLKAEAEQQPRILAYVEYKKLYLQRTQNSELTQDLLSFILKPREEGCPIYLWAAERISESNLLTANGLAMSDQAWLAYTLAFITPEERQILDVPSLAERALYDRGGEVGHVSLTGASQRNFVSNSGLGWLRQGFERGRAWEPGGLRWGFDDGPGTRERNEHLSYASARAA